VRSGGGGGEKGGTQCSKIVCGRVGQEGVAGLNADVIKLLELSTLKMQRQKNRPAHYHYDGKGGSSRAECFAPEACLQDP
jgi:hypothetical protein